MPLLAIIYVLIFIIFALAIYAVMQIKLAGLFLKKNKLTLKYVIKKK